MAGSGPVAALVLGAGRGERLGHALPKAFVPLGGEPLIKRSIRALAASGAFDLIQPVIPAQEFARFAAIDFAPGITGLAEPVAGGEERQDSMRAGLEALPAEIELVAVHDAARCLVSTLDLVAVVAAARKTGAAILGEPARDTIKRVVASQVVETPDRSECWAAQTPQVIRRDWLEAALEAAVAEGRQATDDAQLVEWRGHPVAIVEAVAPNPKMTRPEDLLWAEALLAEGKRAPVASAEGERA